MDTFDIVCIVLVFLVAGSYLCYYFFWSPKEKYHKKPNKATLKKILRAKKQNELNQVEKHKYTGQDYIETRRIRGIPS